MRRRGPVRHEQHHAGNLEGTWKHEWQRNGRRLLANWSSIMQFRSLLCCALSVSAIVLSSCGEAGMNTLQGTVTLDGKPLESGSISFTPVDGQAQTAGGPIQN